MALTIFDALNVMHDPSLQLMPVVVLEIIELVRLSDDVEEVVDPMFDRRIAIPVEKSFMTQFSQETFVFSGNWSG